MQVSVSSRSRQKGAGTPCCSCFETRACLSYTVCQWVWNTGKTIHLSDLLEHHSHLFSAPAASHPLHVSAEVQGYKHNNPPKQQHSGNCRGLLKLAGNVCCRKGRMKIPGKGNCSGIWRAVTAWETGLREGCWSSRVLEGCAEGGVGDSVLRRVGGL